MSSPCVLVVADPDRIAELVAALTEALPSGPIDVVISSGGDDTIELFDARRPAVVVVTASLEAGDASALIDALRGSVPRAEVAIVVIGDDSGPIRTALDAMELAPDRFVNRPVSGKALRYAVASALDAVALVRRSVAESAPHAMPSPDSGRAPATARTPTPPPVPAAVAASAAGGAEPAVGSPTRSELRARWSALADSMDDGVRVPLVAPPPPVLEIVDDGDDGAEPSSPPAAVPDVSSVALLPPPPPVVIQPRRARAISEPAPAAAWRPGTTTQLADDADNPDRDKVIVELPPLISSPSREPTQVLHEEPPVANEVSALAPAPEPSPPPPALAPSRVDTQELWPVPTGVRPAPVRTDSASVAAAHDAPDAPDASRSRDAADASDVASDAPTTSVRPESSATSAAPTREDSGELAPPLAVDVISDSSGGIALPRTSSPYELAAAPDPADSVIVAERGLNESWSKPTPIAEIRDREHKRDVHPASVEQLGLDDFDDDIGLGLGRDSRAVSGLDALGELSRAHAARLRDAERGVEAPPEAARERADVEPPSAPSSGGRDFARQLRAKMSQMAQRLFQGSPEPTPSAADHAPRHDHHTEIDLTALTDDDPPLPTPGVTEIEARARPESREPSTLSSGSWDTQVRDRGIPDSGEIVRGASDAAMILAKLFAQRSTARVSFRREDVEKLVWFDQGRPVFAASNAPADRMGELLVREGKITASQYERCQAHVAESGRRMGEILVDFGYLKRRELLPAVRRHVEDIIYSLFGWDRGVYHIAVEQTPSAERIRLSRHPASLILEGVRRKLDRTSLEKLVGSTAVIEIADRDKLGGIVHLGDLAGEERAALTAFDGQADLAQVARTCGIDAADILPLAWGLCVLGLATARRTEIEPADETSALVGETDLAIDRERVHARWRLVTEADYFALLGVRRDATAFEIRRAYQGARRDFAADYFPTDLRRELAQELEDIAHVLDEAFRVLRDDRLRLTYLENLVE